MLKEHCSIASAAYELASKLQGMPMADFNAFNTRLDEAQIAFPPCFSLQVLLHMASAKQLAGPCPTDLSEMFALKTPLSSSQCLFKAMQPRLHDIQPLLMSDIEKALLEGLFGIVLLHTMTSPDGLLATVAAAETLREACATATIMASTTPSVMAGSSSAADSRSALPANLAWIAELGDVAAAILCVGDQQISQVAMDTLLRVQSSRSGPRKMLSSLFKKDPWKDLSKDTWKYGMGSFTIKPKIQQALQACSSDPEAGRRPLLQFHHGGLKFAPAQPPSWRTCFGRSCWLLGRTSMPKTSMVPPSSYSASAWLAT